MVGLKELVAEINGVHQYNNYRAMLYPTDRSGSERWAKFFTSYAKQMERDYEERKTKRLLEEYRTDKPYRDFLVAIEKEKRKHLRSQNYRKIAEEYTKRKQYLEDFVRSRRPPWREMNIRNGYFYSPQSVKKHYYRSRC